MIFVASIISAAAIALVVIQVDDHLLRAAGLGRIELADRSRVGHSRIQDELGPVALALQAHGERCGLARQWPSTLPLAVALEQTIVGERRDAIQHDLFKFHARSSLWRLYLF